MTEVHGVEATDEAPIKIPWERRFEGRRDNSRGQVQYSLKKPGSPGELKKRKGETLWRPAAVLAG